MIQPKIIIDGFTNGILQDLTLQVGNGFSWDVGCDIYTQPGILQVSNSMSAMDVNATAGMNNIMQIISKGSYLYAQDTSGRLYDFGITTADQWNLNNDYASGSVSAGIGQGMMPYNGQLYGVNDYYLWTLSGSPDPVYDTDYQTLAGGAQNMGYAPMVEWGGTLYVGVGNWVGTLDAAGTWDASAMDLPANYTIRAMASYGDNLVIGAFTPDNYGYLCYWDGEAESYNEIVKLNEMGIRAMIPWRNSLIVFAGLRGNIYEYNGATVNLITSLPNPLTASTLYAIYPNALTEWKGNLVFGTYAATPGDRDNGIYMLTKNPNNPLALSQAFLLTEGTSAIARSLFTDVNGYLYAGLGYAQKGINKLDMTKRIATTAYWESQIYTISPISDPVTVKGIEIVAKPIPTGNSITLKYKIDNDSSWTTWGTITSANQNKVCGGIKGPGKTIQLRLEFTTTGTDNFSPQILEIRIY